ncbi:MAG: hypothetical protein RLZZ135_1279 [Cyanobacteriota bacterium]|jgi:catechol 2,3-dioxygenase-like lactoylglutathione lyase family enzyme
MIDHTGINVSNFENSKDFYTKALAPLDYKLITEFGDAMAGFGIEGEADFWMMRGEVNTPRIHIAFRAQTREMVQAFHTAALAIGGRDNGAPGLRPQYHSNYYAAFVFDPDGHNIEAVCHT